MKDFVKPTLILAAVTLFAGILLAGVNSMTYKRIEMLNKQKEENALQVVLPGFKITETRTDSEEQNYWVAKKTVDGKTINGYAFITESPGYSGTVRTMVGVDEKFIIQGISILTQTETPGLGARCIEVASKNTFLDVITGNAAKESGNVPWFQKQFQKLDASKEIFIRKKGDWNESMAEELRASNEISAITGATITTKAVRDSITKGVEKYKSIITR